LSGLVIVFFFRIPILEDAGEQDCCTFFDPA
jgi:hypothetical protein